MEDIVIIHRRKVDLAALTRIGHDCRPDLCRPAAGCCACHEVCINHREMERVVGCLPQAARFARHLDLPDGLPDPVEQLAPRAYALETDEDGVCLLAYTDRRGRVLCSLHSAAVEMGLDPYQVKPRSCVLWPLAISDRPPRILSVAADALAFPCNRPRRRGARRLDRGIADIVARLFGQPFLDKLHTALARTAAPSAEP